METEIQPLVITSGSKDEGIRIVKYKQQIIEGKTHEMKLANIRIVDAQINEFAEKIFAQIQKDVRERYEKQGFLIVAEHDRVDFEHKLSQILLIYAQVINDMNIGTIFQRSVLSMLAKKCAAYRNDFFQNSAEYALKCKEFLADIANTWESHMFSIAREDAPGSILAKIDEFLASKHVYPTETRRYVADALRSREILVDSVFSVQEAKFCKGDVPEEIMEAIDKLVAQMQQSYSAKFDDAETRSNALTMHDAISSLYENLKTASHITDHSRREYNELKELIEAIENLRESSLYKTCVGKGTETQRVYDEAFETATATFKLFSESACVFFIEYLQRVEEPLHGMICLKSHLLQNQEKCEWYLQQVIMRMNEFDFPVHTKVYICKTIERGMSSHIEYMRENAVNFERISRAYVRNTCENVVKGLWNASYTDAEIRNLYLEQLSKEGITINVREYATNQLIKCGKLASIVKAHTLNPDFTIHERVSVDADMLIPDAELPKIVKKTFEEMMDDEVAPDAYGYVPEA